MTNVVVAGGREDDIALLRGLGANVVAHWNKLGDLSLRPIPKEAELAVVVPDGISVLLVRQLEEKCKVDGIPLVKTGQSWEKFSEALKNPEKFMLDKDDEVLYNQTGESHHKEKAMNKNTERAQQKLALVRQILTRNRFSKTEDIQTEVVKVFGKGVTPMAINNLRTKEFGVKAGPRGIFFDSKGKRIDTTPTPAASKVPASKAQAQAPKSPASEPADITAEFNGEEIPVPAMGATEVNERLSKLVHELRAEMGAQHVRQLSIPSRGPVRAVFEAQFTIQ